MAPGILVGVSLRVLFVVPYFPPAFAYGGIPRLAWGLARSLQDRGHRVEVVTTDAADAKSRAPAGPVDLDGLSVLRLRNRSNALAYHHQLFLPVGARRALRERMASTDIVHLHGYWHLMNNEAVAAAGAAEVPVVMTPNGTLLPHERKVGVKRVWDLVFGRAVRAGVARWIAVSRAELAQFHRAGLPGDRVDLVFNGIDLGEFGEVSDGSDFRERHQLGHGPLVLYLGKLTPRKGVQHLLGAMARLRTPGTVLAVAGNDMGVLASLQERAQSLELGQRVRFLGLVEGEERLSALGTADLLVYPSEHEIFGMVPFEGLLCGTPAVVSDDCGCGELVTQARAGLSVRYGDEGGLAQAIDSLLADEERRRAMVARGRAFIERYLAWSTVAEQTEAVYVRALDSG